MTAPSFSESCRLWLLIAIQSFGGPAGQIAVMHRVLVQERRLIREEDFLHALNFCMLLPGPEAQQLMTYLGWRLHGLRGGLVAGSLFILPGFLSILALSWLYLRWHSMPWLQGLLFGLKAAVLGIIAAAVWRMSQKVIREPWQAAVALGAFLALFAFKVPFAVVVLSAGLIGWLMARFSLILPQGHELSSESIPGFQKSFFTALIGLSLWWGPLLLLGLGLGSSHILWEQARFFASLALVSFGGAYAALSAVAQQAVQQYGWLSPQEMLDGLGLAETTPGPLIQVVQYVGFLGAYRQPEPFVPLVAGLLSSLVVTWATYAPSFLWIFLGAPYLEQLRQHRTLSGALSGISAAVVGVIAQLGLWFGLHTLFGQVGSWEHGWLRLEVPRWETLHLPTLGLGLLALVALQRLNTLWVLGLCLGLGWWLGK